jgi:hypothetical protein
LAALEIIVEFACEMCEQQLRGCANCMLETVGTYHDCGMCEVSGLERNKEKL